jgi:hypothetical protein
MTDRDRALAAWRMKSYTPDQLKAIAMEGGEYGRIAKTEINDRLRAMGCPIVSPATPPR